MKEINLKTSFCVIGGGIAGMCAAIAAARHGIETVLIHDRPVLGGNASSEIRVRIAGAAANCKDMLETGILEEIQLENMYRNPDKVYSIWDSVLYGLTQYQDNLTLLLNCTCNRLEMQDGRIKSITAWQMTTEKIFVVEAGFFADCSGDSTLAPLCGAEFRYGRESRREFNESIPPEKADDATMGMSCLIQARQYDSPKKYIPPKWAYVFDNDEALPHRNHSFSGMTGERKGGNFWFLELGGMHDSVHDTEQLREELLKIAFGVWDHIKNRGEHSAENWALDWVGFLPGKRESRRYVGDYILNENDVVKDRNFPDKIAYGGWAMDDHNPIGFYCNCEPTIFHKAASPYSIPYRCLYSKNIPNLLCAGRNISTSHMAFSSTRLMGTCAIIGQAAGCAAALALKKNLSQLRDLLPDVGELQQILLDEDCYLPNIKRRVPQISLEGQLTASCADPLPLINGIDRPTPDNENCWKCKPGDWVQYSFDKPVKLSQARTVFDSDLNRDVFMMKAMYFLNAPSHEVPHTLVKSYIIEYKDRSGVWQELVRENCNIKRFVIHKFSIETDALRLRILHSWGCESLRVFAFDIR